MGMAVSDLHRPTQRAGTGSHPAPAPHDCLLALANIWSDYMAHQLKAPAHVLRIGRRHNYSEWEPTQGLDHTHARSLYRMQHRMQHYSKAPCCPDPNRHPLAVHYTHQCFSVSLIRQPQCRHPRPPVSHLALAPRQPHCAAGAMKSSEHDGHQCCSVCFCDRPQRSRGSSKPMLTLLSADTPPPPGPPHIPVGPHTQCCSVRPPPQGSHTVQGRNTTCLVSNGLPLCVVP